MLPLSSNASALAVCRDLALSEESVSCVLAPSITPNPKPQTPTPRPPALNAKLGRWEAGLTCNSMLLDKYGCVQMFVLGTSSM